MTNWFRNVGQWLLYGGSARPRPYEAAILERVASELPAADSLALLEQIRSVDRVQRSLGDRMVMFHFKSRGAQPTHLSAKGDAHCLAKLELEGAGGRSIAAVITHRGILSTLEFARSPKGLFAHGVRVLSMARAASWRGPAEAADRLEHGAGS